MRGPVPIPVEAVRAALAEVARTVRWPDGTLLLDVDLAVLDDLVAPALAAEVQSQLASIARGAA